MGSKQHIYRLTFINQDTIYEIYAKKIKESEMFSFLEVEEFVFGENTTLVVDPAEERLKLEFTGVKRTYIPMHSIVRIDQVEKEGVATTREAKTGRSNVSLFPRPTDKSDGEYTGK